MTYVPYLGSSPAISALMGGHVISVFTDYGSVAEQLKAGALRALAASSWGRWESSRQYRRNCCLLIRLAILLCLEPSMIRRPPTCALHTNSLCERSPRWISPTHQKKRLLGSCHSTAVGSVAERALVAGNWSSCAYRMLRRGPEAACLDRRS
jgi:hypothetical protein